LNHDLGFALRGLLRTDAIFEALAAMYSSSAHRITVAADVRCSKAIDSI
jgi:hypothetical protein